MAKRASNLFRRQSLTDSELLKFSKRFGNLYLDANKYINFDDATLKTANPELFLVSNLYYPDGNEIGGLGNDELMWHTHLIYRPHRASGSIFYYHHHWRNCEVVMWDNARLPHLRDAFGNQTPRLAERTTAYLDKKILCRSPRLLSAGPARPMCPLVIPNSPPQRLG